MRGWLLPSPPLGSVFSLLADRRPPREDVDLVVIRQVPHKADKDQGKLDPELKRTMQRDSPPSFRSINKRWSVLVNPLVALPIE
jgi:hypothetical protein